VDRPNGHSAPIQPPGVYDQNPRFHPCRKLVTLRGLSSFVGDCPKRDDFDRHCAPSDPKWRAFDITDSGQPGMDSTCLWP
jgi:hypothetical protein